MTQINLKEVHDLKVVGALWCQIEVYLYLFDLEIYLIRKKKKISSFKRLWKCLSNVKTIKGVEKSLPSFMDRKMSHYDCWTPKFDS